MIESELRAELVNTARFLGASGLLFRGDHANLSARLDDHRILMTRGGSVAKLAEDDLSVLDLNGNILDGSTMDSRMREVVDMHTRVYHARENVGAVIHCHSPYITTFAVAHVPLPIVYEPLLRYGFTQAVPVIPWAPRGSEASVSGILGALNQDPELPAVMLANHGVLSFYRDLASTANLLASLDEAAQLVLQARALGGAQPLPDAAMAAVKERMAKFHKAPR